MTCPHSPARTVWDVISDTCDLEPVDGWSTATELPTLADADVALILRDSAPAVMKRLELESAVIAESLASRAAGALTRIGNYLRRQTEKAARETIFGHVRHECEQRRIARERRTEAQVAADHAGVSLAGELQ